MECQLLTAECGADSTAGEVEGSRVEGLSGWKEEPKAGVRTSWQCPYGLSYLFLMPFLEGSAKPEWLTPIVFLRWNGCTASSTLP